ncbi:HAD-like protein [Crepidotus variabilis]|uniref:HAD-like protein n=1 Tax=Crepidotus variabilis TaxID=179855 RepID=A0A9P6EVS2_9AGAR|nr:HAD-like protein [Crepidotus variabilis]
MINMESRTFAVDAILFDMDGTLIDSTPGVLSAWQTWSEKYNLGDGLEMAHKTHGRRLHDTLQEYCRINDPHKLMDEVNLFEDEVIRGGPKALPGAVELLSKLMSLPEAEKRWTIVTSASNKYAPAALERAGIPVPPVGVITANDVVECKPHPAPYLAGAALLSTDPKKCLVVEDAISGLNAGHAAKALTLAVCTSTKRELLLASAKPDFIVADLSSVKIDWVDGRILVTLTS